MLRAIGLLSNNWTVTCSMRHYRTDTLIGITFEERDLLRQFGEPYRICREQVGMQIPRGKSSRWNAGNAAGPAD